ncbi:hypothetical protein [Flavisolibacter tropicus]|uniref:YbjN domain-containing protein n=1 Tax=Flavisolibacter tropicus TaxID=1492898 RepID=A0A172TXG4_9BACT|nr:hypothetical protein [Flavisolibacter tropicus]ANE51785.1 hypothetical protein SY85_16095 [Flavisolibacter tropicus]
MLSTLFNWTKKKDGEVLIEPDIQFGRYSDNNKPVEKVDKWNEADTLFKDKKYYESISAFFDYLCDEAANNVVHKPEGQKGTFLFYQGSKIIKGFYNEERLEAEVSLASMPTPSVPVMRRLLEMNFTLYYSRYALSEDRLAMMFDSDIETANPSKLYYGLKELATKADKQDDLLVQDFTTLKPVETDHILEIPVAEKEIKYRYMQNWIKETLDLIETVDADKYSGGIAYLLLALAYRIDYLLVPEGRLLLNLEKIVDIYFRKDDRPVSEKNAEMIDEFHKLQAKTKEEVYPHLFRSRYTFSIVTPQNHKTIADAIYNANQNIGWYKDNKHPDIAAKISEYGIAYCQYSYSLPRPLTELFQLFMMVNYPDYFKELGFKTSYYNSETKEFNKEAITKSIESIQEHWKPKYPDLKFPVDKLKFDDMVSFNQTFTSEVEFLNLETK